MIALLALMMAGVLGFVAQSHSPAVRATDPIPSVSHFWYDALPRDPASATATYLTRVPAVMRDRGDAVGRTRYWALAARIVANLGAVLLFLYSGAARALDAAMARAVRRRWLRDLLFSLVLLVFVFAVTLPVEVCASYIRNRAFGFSEQPFIGWVQDYAIGWTSTAIFYAVGITLLMAMIRRLPRNWFLFAGAIYLALAFLYTAATPMVIEPLTNTYTPLAGSELKSDILAMARRAGVPADNVYTDDASRQSRRLNGHVSGAFGTARITIDDTALTSSPEAVKALAAHEMGHYVMHHPFKMVLLGTLVAMLGFAFIAWLEPLLIQRMGARWGVADVTQTGAIAVFWLLFTAWGFVSDPLTNAYARVQETQADAFSLALAQEPTGLADFMIQDADIGPLQPTMTDLILFYDHPSDAARVRAAMQWRALHAPTR